MMFSHQFLNGKQTQWGENYLQLDNYYTLVRNENMPEDELMMNDGIHISQGAENCVTFSEINCCICFSLRTVFTLQTITFFYGKSGKALFSIKFKI
jgi:hypothetical protein